MKASKMIEELSKIIQNVGDLEIVGGDIFPDIAPRKLSVISKDGSEIPFFKYKTIDKDSIDGIYLE